MLRGNHTESNRPLQLDQYDLDDSFIDDTDEALQTYLYSAYSRGKKKTVITDVETSTDVPIEN